MIAFDEDIKKSIIAFATSLRKALIPFVDATKKFGIAYYQMAEKQYLTEHPRLPGSLRTKRLRKKRQRIILDWFSCYLNRLKDTK